MSRKKSLVQWSPHYSNNFVIGSSDLRLFEVVVDYSSDKVNASSNVSVQRTGDSAAVPASSTHSYVRKKRSFRTLGVIHEVSQLKCIDWNPSPNAPFVVCAGSSLGALSIGNFNPTFSKASLSSNGSIIREFTPKYNRPCNVVAWNPLNVNNIACGYEKMRGEHSVLIWDCQQKRSNFNSDLPGNGRQRNRRGLQTQNKSSTCVYEFANSEATTALSWVPTQAQMLVAGTSFKWLRIYDLRSSAIKPAPLSVSAHQKGVYGVKFDPNNASTFATFSDDGLVKVWDFRRIEEPLVCIEQVSGSKKIAQVGWSPVRSGLLAVATGDARCINLYDTHIANEDSNIPGTGAKPPLASMKKSASSGNVGYSLRPAMDGNASRPNLDGHLPDTAGMAAVESNFNKHPHLSELHHMGGIVPGLLQGDDLQGSMVHQGKAPDSTGLSPPMNGHAGEVSTTPAIVIQKPYRKRYTTNVVANFAWRPASTSFGSRLTPNRSIPLVQPTSPNTVGNRDSDVENRMLIIFQNNEVEDISLQDSMPIGFSKGGDLCFGLNKMLFSSPTNGVDSVGDMQLRASMGYSVDCNRNCEIIAHLCEQERQTRQDLPGPDLPHSLDDIHSLWAWIRQAVSLNLGDLSNAGIAFILENDANGEDVTYQESSKLRRSLSVFHSRRRALAMQLCGWGDTPPPTAVDTQLETRLECDYERAATLSVFQCNLRRAVAALEEGAATFVRRSELEGRAELFREHAELFHVAAVTFAGFPQSANAQLWKESCERLRGRLFHFPALRTACSFLLSVHEDEGGIAAETTKAETSPLRCVLEEPQLSLADRTAFACMFLPDRQLREFVRINKHDAVGRGSLHGILFTGMQEDGLELLQRYLDHTGDVQTVALASLFVRNHNAQISRWMQCYRGLLNAWQLWEERAMVDVRVGQLERSRESPESKDIVSSTATQASAAANSSLLNTTKPHLHIRCFSCSKSLLMETMVDALNTKENTNKPWLRKQKSALQSCPNCRKRLPSCAICLLSMSSANPYRHVDKLLEINKARQHSTHQQVPLRNSSRSLSSQFDRWFTWCLRCRHGGHAACLAEWFSIHTRCPVSNCTCECSVNPGYKLP